MNSKWTFLFITLSSLVLISACSPVNKINSSGFTANAIGNAADFTLNTTSAAKKSTLGTYYPNGSWGTQTIQMDTKNKRINILLTRPMANSRHRTSAQGEFTTFENALNMTIPAGWTLHATMTHPTQQGIALLPYDLYLRSDLSRPPVQRGTNVAPVPFHRRGMVGPAKRLDVRITEVGPYVMVLATPGQRDIVLDAISVSKSVKLPVLRYVSGIRM